MPRSVADYIHRIGRTGRAGHTGTAITYYQDVDLPMAKAVANLIQGSGGKVPKFLNQVKVSKRQKQRAKNGPPPKRGKIRQDRHVQRKKRKQSNDKKKEVKEN